MATTPTFTETESIALCEAIETHIDGSDDWQLETTEHNEAVEFWATMAEKIGHTFIANRIRKEHRI